jgi:hypothetical protein
MAIERAGPLGKAELQEMRRPKRVAIFAYAWLFAANLTGWPALAPSADQTLELSGILENRPIDVSGVIRVRLKGAEKASGKIQGIPTALHVAPPKSRQLSRMTEFL